MTWIQFVRIALQELDVPILFAFPQIMMPNIWTDGCPIQWIKYTLLGINIRTKIDNLATHITLNKLN